MIHQLCTEVTGKIPAIATPRAKVEKLVAALKAFRMEMHTIKTQLEQQITDLQAKLQLGTPSKVCAQRAALATDVANVISG